MAAEPKTKATAASVDDYLDAIADDKRREDCIAIAALMARVAGQGATMWGPSIVGFGSYHYKYDSGHEGDACEVGFASRKDSIVLYLGYDSPERADTLARLGKHKAGKGCVYIKRLADIDTGVLEAMVRATVDGVRARYPVL
jgi:hypothetical protein